MRLAVQLCALEIFPPTLSVHLFLCVEELSFSLGIYRSDLRFPLVTGSPNGTSQCLLEFGSLVLSLHVFFVSLVARACRPDAPLPRSLRLYSFESLRGVFEEGSLLCPVLSLHAYLEWARGAVSRAPSLFVSPCSPSRLFHRTWGRFFYGRCFRMALFVRVQVPRLERLVFAGSLPLRFL